MQVQIHSNYNGKCEASRQLTHDIEMYAELPWKWIQKWYSVEISVPVLLVCSLFSIHNSRVFYATKKNNRMKIFDRNTRKILISKEINKNSLIFFTCLGNFQLEDFKIEYFRWCLSYIFYSLILDTKFFHIENIQTIETLCFWQSFPMILCPRIF